MNGFLNVYKPRGMSSAHCLNKIKKKIDYKCGHMGTLDPLASGVLPVGVGKASRLFQYLLDKEKIARNGEFWKWFCITAPVLLLIIFSLIFQFVRKNQNTK